MTVTWGVTQLRKFGVVIAVLMSVAGFGAGVLVADAHGKIQPTVAATAQAPNHELAPECRAALQIAGQGLGLAASGLGQAQSAASAANGAANAPSPALGVISATTGRVQGLLQQYNAAQATCQSLSAAQSGSSSTK